LENFESKKQAGTYFTAKVLVASGHAIKWENNGTGHSDTKSE
jgi:plastocyanin